MDSVGKVFGQNVRRLRHDRGWTQEELAKRAGATQGTITAIERGVGGSFDTVTRIAKALEVPEVVLVSSTEKEVDLSTAVRAVLAALSDKLGPGFSATPPKTFGLELDHVSRDLFELLSHTPREQLIQFEGVLRAINAGASHGRNNR